MSSGLGSFNHLSSDLGTIPMSNGKFKLGIDLAWLQNFWKAPFESKSDSVAIGVEHLVIFRISTWHWIPALTVVIALTKVVESLHDALYPFLNIATEIHYNFVTIRNFEKHFFQVFFLYVRVKALQTTFRKD